jgi:transposase
MPYRKISPDVKIAAIRLYERDLLPLEDILDCCRFSRRTFFRILRLWRTTGDVVNHTYGCRGKHRILVTDDVQYLLRLVRHRPDWFQDELADHLLKNRFISVNFSTICRELKRVGFSLKKLKKLHQNGVKKNERNLSIVWLSTHLSSWASSTRHQKMIGFQAGVSDMQKRANEQEESKYLFVDIG